MSTIGKGSISSLLAMLLAVAWYGVVLVLTLATCVLVASPFIDLAGAEMDIPVSFTVDGEALRVSAPSLGIATAQIQDVRGSLSFAPPGRASVAVTLLLVILILSLVLWVLGQLCALFRTLRDGRPFVPENAARIRWIGLGVIVGELARAAAVFSANSYAVTHFSATGLRFDTRPDLSVFAIVHGLIILAIAEVFRAGMRLDEDQSLTI